MLMLRLTTGKQALNTFTVCTVYAVPVREGGILPWPRITNLYIYWDQKIVLHQLSKALAVKLDKQCIKVQASGVP